MVNKKTKFPKVTDEGWNSQKQLSDPVEKKRKRRRKLLYPHPKLFTIILMYWSVRKS